jgi:hypothetical protein
MTSPLSALASRDEEFNFIIWLSKKTKLKECYLFYPPPSIPPAGEGSEILRTRVLWITGFYYTKVLLLHM